MVCAKCSGQKFPLTYEDNKLSRVCRGCFHQLILNQRQQLSPTTVFPPAEMEATLANGNGVASPSNGHLNGEEGVDDDEEEANGVSGRPRGLLEVREREGLSDMHELLEKVTLLVAIIPLN